MSRRIGPSTAYPSYWQFEGKPILLLGGSVEDNLFQIADLQEHLDLLSAVGQLCALHDVISRRGRCVAV